MGKSVSAIGDFSGTHGSSASGGRSRLRSHAANESGGFAPECRQLPFEGAGLVENARKAMREEHHHRDESATHEVEPGIGIGLGEDRLAVVHNETAQNGTYDGESAAHRSEDDHLNGRHDAND